MNWINKVRLFFILALLFSSFTVAAQTKKLGLDDVEIKGELLRDDRLNMSRRDRNEMKNYIQFRAHYRKEMIEQLPRPHPTVAPEK